MFSDNLTELLIVAVERRLEGAGGEADIVANTIVP
jgi:hypothetical protein